MEKEQLNSLDHEEPYGADGEKEFVCSEPNHTADLMNAAKSKRFLWANVSFTAGSVNALVIPVILTGIIIQIIVFFSAFTGWMSFAANILSFLRNVLSGIAVVSEVLRYADNVLSIGRFSTVYGPVILILFIWLPVLTKTAALVGSWMMFSAGKKNNSRLAVISVKILIISTVISFAGVVSVPAVLLVSALTSAELLLGLIIVFGVFCAGAAFLYIGCISGLNKFRQTLNGETPDLSLRCFKISLFVFGVFSVLSLRLFFGIYCFTVCSMIGKLSAPLNNTKKG